MTFEYDDEVRLNRLKEKLWANEQELQDALLEPFEDLKIRPGRKRQEPTSLDELEAAVVNRIKAAAVLIRGKPLGFPHKYSFWQNLCDRVSIWWDNIRGIECLPPFPAYSERRPVDKKTV